MRMHKPLAEAEDAKHRNGDQCKKLKGEKKENTKQTR